MTNGSLNKTMPQFYVYIMSSKTGTMYTGVNGDLHEGVRQHNEGKISGLQKGIR